MKKSRFSDQQIAFALQQAETGTSVADVCRKLGISEATFYRWKERYGGLIDQLMVFVSKAEPYIFPVTRRIALITVPVALEIRCDTKLRSTPNCEPNSGRTIRRPIKIAIP